MDSFQRNGWSLCGGIRNYALVYGIKEVLTKAGKGVYAADKDPKGNIEQLVLFDL
ncbi:hypothetical protein DSCA_03090 [Desulfosarcina alkanivorans]|uniref:Uncharacterized protein n=1 Tax=Desulfosarcina alkanivorans TaxID=571177 RepID=A0A5K7YF53_9BACT|nr:hypothetical protein DSCA_03090 [Desulfosarcina alkanivorans]